MSTLAYAALTTKRDLAAPGTSQTTAAPGVKSYVDALAALVPAEVLTLHALIISVTTTTTGDTTKLSEPATLTWAFWGLLVVAAALYAAPRLLDREAHWDQFDWLRVLIPPLAFVGWTMMQRATAFDAVFPAFAQSPRTVAALFLAVVLGAVATALAYKADQKQP
jgi:hypothetical protein